MEEEKSQLIQQMRLSEAYPLNSQNNFEYLADCHKMIAQASYVDKIKLSDVKFRKMLYKSDVVQIKQLHREWFPINYQEEFYEAGIKGSNCDNFYQLSKLGHTQTAVAEVRLSFPTGRKENVIIGGMFYRSKRAKCGYMKYPLREWKEWLCFKMNDSFSIYIMTIGVANEFRGLGIAKSFLQSIKQFVFQHEQLLYIYLDVVCYNYSAIKFYEKEGFVRVRVKEKHYEIEGALYDAYVLVWYRDPSKNISRKNSTSEKRSRIQQILQLPCTLMKGVKNLITK